LDEKAGKYGTVTEPFVIAVLDLSEYSPGHDGYARALYGTLTDGPRDNAHLARSVMPSRDGSWPAPFNRC
jgi:hypothetical protein